MEIYILHVQLDNGNLLQYRYQLPAEPFDTVITDARAHRKEGRHVLLFREQTQTGCGWVILEPVITFT